MLKLPYRFWRDLWHGGLPPRSAVSLLFALACVAVATIVRIGLGEISPASAVFAPYYSATLVAALVGGAEAGGLAAASGALAAFWLFVPPDWSSRAFDREQLVSFFLFAASSWIIVWAAKSYRALLWRLREEQNRRQLLNNELAHRIKNILAIVQAVLSQTLRDQPDLREKLNDRIAALGVTNDLLIQSEWRSASLHKILAGEFAPFDAFRFRLNGEDFECPSEIATVLALIFHELTTNAVKYGALSVPQGRVALSWVKRRDRIEFEWIETGGPPPQPSPREGFGTTLLRKGLRQFDGSVERQLAPTGLRCTFSLSVPSAQRHELIDIAADRSLPARVISTPQVETTAR